MDFTSSLANNENETYSLEDILEMMGGSNNYFSEDQIMFVYHKINKRLEEADVYLQRSLDYHKALQRKCNKMSSKYELKTPDECIEALENTLSVDGIEK